MMRLMSIQRSRGLLWYLSTDAGRQWALDVTTTAGNSECWISAFTLSGVDTTQLPETTPGHAAPSFECRRTRHRSGAEQRSGEFLDCYRRNGQPERTNLFMDDDRSGQSHCGILRAE